MSLGKFSVKNPVLINILMITILILGGLSLQRLPREQFSEVPFFWVNIIVPYPGASAEDIEKSVTIPIEDEMQGIEDLKQIQSVTSEGLSVVRVEFDDGISNDKFDSLFQEAQTRFSRVELPSGTLKGLIDDFSSSDFLPVIEVIISGDADFNTLNSTALNLRDDLRGVSEVSGITVVGSRDRQVQVEIKGDILSSLNIGINEISGAISGQNITVPGGTLETENRNYLIRTIGELRQAEDFENIIIRRGGQDGLVRIRDIAEVKEGYDSGGVTARLNGEPSITLQVAKVARGNSVGVIEDVKIIVDEYTKTLPPGIKVTLFNDSTLQIQDSISTLVNNALWGIILLIVILYFFIGLRNALMTGLGIPITFAVTFLILEVTGETFNTNTLFGMVLVLGLIVDHAIVVIENSFRLQQGGLSRMEAAIKGTDQVVVPVIAATATTVAAFLPLMILPGTIGKFLRVIPFTVSIALIASTAEAIIFLPSHFADWPGGKKTRKEKFYPRIKAFYSRILDKVYNRKGIAVVLLFIFMILSFGLVALLDQDLFSAEDFTYFSIDIEMAPGTPSARTLEAVEDFEERLLPLVGNGEVVSILSSVGFSGGQSGNTEKSNLAQITVDLAERSQGRTRSISVIMEDIKQLCSTVSGLESVNYSKAVNGPPTSSPISFRLFGNDYEALQAVSRGIKDKLAEYPELLNIGDNLENGSPELRVRVNPELLSRYGLTVLDVGSSLRTLFDGVPVSTFFRENEIIDVVVLFSKENIDSVFDLENLFLTTFDGRQIPFSSIATIEPADAFASIKRIDGKREITIESGAYSTENVRQINKDVEAFFNENFSTTYPDIEFVAGGEFSDFNDLLFQILRIFLIGVFLIYLILGTQFKSYTQPLIILLTVPFAFTGVVLYLFVSGTPFSTTVLYAGVALAGIAVNDSIVLISFINELRGEGMKIAEAIKEAAATRLRPILLTSLTTISGLIPTALGLGGKSVVWGPMASTIIFGLIFSTLTALVFIPVLYGLIYERGEKKADRKRLVENSEAMA
ncbi:MAG: efflux RND transporter permease subunit [Spirochaetales bacterium]|nr:efflux RND transporter permease subunit [Spirochaetales bacterium]